MSVCHYLVWLCFLLIIIKIDGLNNGLAIKPQMGYNTWYDLGCSITEDLVRSTADSVKSLELDKLGYSYVNLDDCWAQGRYSNGSVYASTPTFSSPSLKPLADYIHSLNLQFGVYTDRGNYTCAKRPGSYGYEQNDADSYAAWGVDYVKEDSCDASGDHNTAFNNYATMRDALNSTGRPILFSLCGWNSWYSPVGQSLSNSWRIGPDDTNWNGVLTNIDINVDLYMNAGPGGWNDPCLLLAEDMHGNQRVTELQSKAQFSMWAIMKSPLLISANLRNMSQANIDTYSNINVININQDALGKQGQRIFGGDLSNYYKKQDKNGINIWFVDLIDGSKAFVFLNVKSDVQNITCNAACFEAAGYPKGGLNVKIYDLWNGNKDLGTISTANTYGIPNVLANGGVEMYKFVTLF